MFFLTVPPSRKRRKLFFPEQKLKLNRLKSLKLLLLPEKKSTISLSTAPVPAYRRRRPLLSMQIKKDSNLSSAVRNRQRSRFREKISGAATSWKSFSVPGKTTAIFHNLSSLPTIAFLPDAAHRGRSTPHGSTA